MVLPTQRPVGTKPTRLGLYFLCCLLNGNWGWWRLRKRSVCSGTDGVSAGILCVFVCMWGEGVGVHRECSMWRLSRWILPEKENCWVGIFKMKCGKKPKTKVVIAKHEPVRQPSQESRDYNLSFFSSASGGSSYSCMQTVHWPFPGSRVRAA